MSNIVYECGGKELLDLVGPLWEKLNAHHKANSKYFVDRFENFTYETRKARFLSDLHAYIRVDLVKDKVCDAYVGYCVSTISKDQLGEVDSLYIEHQYRKLGIGDELMKRALGWMDDNNTKTKIIAVAEGNEAVFDFYKRYGFYTRRIILEQVEK